MNMKDLLGNTADLLIVSLYLIIITVVSRRAGRNTASTKDFCVAGKGLTTPIVTAAVTATMVGAGSTFGCIEGLVHHGAIVLLVFFIGESFSKILTGFLFARRMARLQQYLSIGEVIESFYGRPSRILTGLIGTTFCLGVLAIQIMAFSRLYGHFLGWPPLAGAIVSCLIIVIYTTLGGIRSFTPNDAIQFLFIITGLFTISDAIMIRFGNIHVLMEYIPQALLNPFPSTSTVLHYAVLFLPLIMLPSLDPAISQRLLMARDVGQMRRALIVSGLVDAPIFLMVGIIGFTAAAFNTTITATPHEAFSWVVNFIFPAGLRGFAIAGLTSLLLATADSYLISGAICFVHDVITPLRREPFADQRERFLIRIAAALLGPVAIVIVMHQKNIIQLMLHLFNLWIPTVLFPLYAGIIGLRSKPYTFFAGIMAAAVTTGVWEFYRMPQELGVSSVWPALGMHLVVFFVVHYCLGGALPFVPYEETLEDKRWRSLTYQERPWWWW